MARWSSIASVEARAPSLIPSVTIPALSLVVLAWNQLELTTRCVRSLREGTSNEHELIVVDNGSTDGGREYANNAGDKAILNETNLGFAAGMNTGLALAEGEYTVFANNDTFFPPGWDGPLLQTFATHPRAGIVLPAVTAAGNPVSVRTEPGTTVETLLPFGEFPSGVVYMVRTDVIRSLGGWNEEFERASGEDLDLAFTIWAHGLDVVLDSRILVEHASQASMKEVPGLTALYRKNLEQFLDRWDTGPDGPLLDTIGREDYLRNLERARTAVAWIRRMLEARGEAASLRNRIGERKGRWLRSRS